VSRTFLVLFAILSGTPLSAQTVVRPAPPLDSTRAAVRDALLVLRDSLGTIDGAAARLQRDYQQASGASLLSRAKLMEEACARSLRTVQPTRRAVLTARVSEPQRTKHQRELVNALDTLKLVLNHCESEFADMSRSGQAETVRGYGNDRAGRVLAALRRYEQTLHQFFGVMGIRVPPAGVGFRPASGR
jgi:hypothetical protein